MFFYCTTTEGIKCRRLLKTVFTQRTHHPSICLLLRASQHHSAPFRSQLKQEVHSLNHYSTQLHTFASLASEASDLRLLSSARFPDTESSVVTWTRRLLRLKSSRNDQQWSNITAHCTCLSPVRWTHYFPWTFHKGGAPPCNETVV